MFNRSAIMGDTVLPSVYNALERSLLGILITERDDVKCIGKRDRIFSTQPFRLSQAPAQNSILKE